MAALAPRHGDGASLILSLSAIRPSHDPWAIHRRVARWSRWRVAAAMWPNCRGRDGPKNRRVPMPGAQPLPPPGNGAPRPGPRMKLVLHVARVSRCANAGKPPGNCTENPSSARSCRDWPDYGGRRPERTGLAVSMSARRIPSSERTSQKIRDLIQELEEGDGRLPPSYRVRADAVGQMTYEKDEGIRMDGRSSSPLTTLVPRSERTRGMA